MNDDPREVINPVHLDTVVPGSASVLTSPEAPGKVIVKAQLTMPPSTSLCTVLLHLDRDDAQR